MMSLKHDHPFPDGIFPVSKNQEAIEDPPCKKKHTLEKPKGDSTLQKVTLMLQLFSHLGLEFSPTRSKRVE